METKDYIRLIARRFGEYDRQGDEIAVNCPFCFLRGHTPDTKKKLYINVTKGVVHCFRCNHSGRAADLLPQVAVLEAKQSTTDFEEAKLEPLPEGIALSDLPSTHTACTYIESRGFTVKGLGSRAYFCEDYCKGKYSFGPRLILPVYQMGGYQGFQARALISHDAKYVNASGMNKKVLLYNYDRVVSQSKELIITEGIFDCLKSGPTAVAAFGKAISDEQVRLISLNSFDRIYVILDPEARDDAKAVARRLAMHFNTYILQLSPGVDPGMLITSQIRTLLDRGAAERVF